jgi:hypothetical protein
MRTSHQWRQKRAGSWLLRRLVLAHLWGQEVQEGPELLAALPDPAIQLFLLALQDQPDQEDLGGP